MKIYQFLQKTFKLRILSDAEIPSYMKRVTQVGKFDEPKKNVLITELLIRVAELEDKIEQLETINKPVDMFAPVADAEFFIKPIELSNPLPEIEIAPGITYEDQLKSLSWNDLRKKAKDLGVFDKTANKEKLISLIQRKV